MNRREITLYVLSSLMILWIISSPVRSSSGEPLLPDQDSTKVESLLVVDTIGLQISGPSNDVSFYMNGFIFLSNTKYHQKMIPDHISFGVIKAYFVPLDYQSLESSRPLFPNDDFPYSPAGMSFSRDYSKVYFTKTVELAGRRNVEKIFEMEIEEGKATAHQQVPFTTEPSRYLHPAVSHDDSILVFSSDRTPSSGGLDLFVTRKTESGWSYPVNMGRGINTSGHEWYPFIDHNRNLYFASSGHMGFGGYDLYVCLWNGTGWGVPKNLTSFVNTPGDELAFSIHPNNRIAIFNRTMDAAAKPDILTIQMNKVAFPRSESADPRSQDICLLIRDLTGSGYTPGEFQAAAEQSSPQAFNLVAMPLLTLEEAEEDRARDQIRITPVTQTSSEETTKTQDDQVNNFTIREVTPQSGPDTNEVQEAANPPPVPAGAADPDRLNFRVQILSSTRPNTRPEVTVDGKKYPTFEYFHKGAYRITVGDFPTVREANAFRAKCKSSGFNQSFVAAFRGETRETDPSVFRQ